MKDVALVGLPSCGKSSVFTAVTGHAPARGAVAVVPVPDDRVTRLAEILRSKKTTYAQLEVVDVAGLDPHSLGAARAADALAIVLRAFGPDVDLRGDLASFRAELAVADLQTMEKVRDRATKQAKGGSAERKRELEVAERAEAALSDERWLSEVDWAPEEREVVSLWTPLTLKPAFHVVNSDEAFAGAEEVPAPAVGILGAVEAEATELASGDAAELLGSYGIDEPASGRFVRAAYAALDLITFYTGNGQESRAWDLGRGARAPKAAGAIHSDFERGFIRAERVSFDDIVAAGSFESARERGLVRVEGKDYVVQDGDYLAILHS